MDLQQNNNILITGASGFVGKHLTNFLTAQGFNVVACNLRNKNWQLDFENHSYYAVIHLAGIAHQLKGASSAAIYEQINVGLAKDVFHAFLQSNATQFYFFSSIKALANESDTPLQENDFQQIDNDYGLSKRKAEQVLWELLPPNSPKKLYILRPTMIYGHQAKGNFALLEKLVEKRIPYPLSKIENQRNLLYINNLNFVVCQFLNAHIASGIFNICDDQAVSVPQLIKWMRLYSNKSTINLTIPLLFLQLGFKLNARLKSVWNRLTANFLIDNSTLKNALKITQLPYSTEDAIREMYQNKDVK